MVKSAREMKNGNGKRRWQPQLSDGRVLFEYVGTSGQLEDFWLEQDKNGETYWMKLYRFKWLAERKARKYEHGIREDAWEVA